MACLRPSAAVAEWLLRNRHTAAIDGQAAVARNGSEGRLRTGLDRNRKRCREVGTMFCPSRTKAVAGRATNRRSQLIAERARVC